MKKKIYNKAMMLLVSELRRAVLCLWAWTWEMEARYDPMAAFKVGGTDD